jgi:hypothetical protein
MSPVERLRSDASGGPPFEKSSSTPGGPLGVIAAALVAVCVVRPGMRQGAALLLCCATLGTVSGCGSRVQAPQASATVIVVQASSGAGPNALAHAVQVVVIAR